MVLERLQDELKSAVYMHAFISTYQRSFFREGLQEGLQQLISIVNPFSILPNDPDHAGLGFRLIQCVQILTQSGNDALVSTHSTHSLSCVG